MTYSTGGSSYPPAQQHGPHAPTTQFSKTDDDHGLNKLPVYLLGAVVVLGLAGYLVSFGPVWKSSEMGTMGGSSITGGSFGLQIGVQGVDLVMLVMNDRGMQALLSSKFKVGVDASAAAGPVGRTASADTNWKLNSEILTYSRAKGLFAGIDINGAEVKQDDKTTNDLYGKSVSFQQILSGQVRTPGPAREFVAEVHRDFAEARASK